VKKHLLIISAFLLVTCASCNKSSINGIELRHTLVENQSYDENKELIQLIEKTLKKDSESLIKLMDFWCGGAAGCYDLGYVLTQIAYKVGEDEFHKMIKHFTKSQKSSLTSFLNVGSKYGNYKNKTLDKEFPLVFKFLSE
jgi:hypothetical protein